jgi:hypothetical protein
VTRLPTIGYNEAVRLLDGLDLYVSDPGRRLVRAEMKRHINLIKALLTAEAVTEGRGRKGKGAAE